MSESKNDTILKKKKESHSNNVIYDFVKELFRIVYELLVGMVGNFVADILDHPRVQRAAAETLVRGMKLTMEQPDLPHRAAQIYIEIQEDTDVSRQLGEQFPKVAANFLKGAATSLKRSASFSNLRQRRRSSLPTINSSNSFDHHYQQQQEEEQEEEGSMRDQPQHVNKLWSPITSYKNKISTSSSSTTTTTIDGQYPDDDKSAATREEVVIQQLSSLSWRNNKAFNRVESLTSIASIDSMN